MKILKNDSVKTAEDDKNDRIRMKKKALSHSHTVIHSFSAVVMSSFFHPQTVILTVVPYHNSRRWKKGRMTS